ncbi:MAG: DUF4038 domain-containing protein [Phycisphaerae bacterium]
MADTAVRQFDIHEKQFHHTGSYDNPYRQCEARVEFTSPGGEIRPGSLFWDGENVWRFRFSPDTPGRWEWRTRSSDAGLDGKTGSFECIEGDLRGAPAPWPERPNWLRYQNGDPFYVFGDTQWAYTTSRPEDGCDRQAVMAYADTRAQQGFNLLNIKLMAWGRNEGGDAWSRAGEYDPVGREQKLNPAFWQEVDVRLGHLRPLGITAFCYISWQKRDPEAKLVSWDMFPDQSARLRYARYIAARYGAGNTMFCVAGEWKPGRGVHIDGDTRASVAQIGAEFRRWDPHRRVLCVHGGGRGTVHPYFAREPWCDLGDCQQVYRERHGEIINARVHGKPVFNAEYGYWMRKFHDGMDGPKGMRAITWEIAMAGGYFVTGWGSTYFGGLRHPTPFGCEADDENWRWDEQVIRVRELFQAVPWWRMEPRDELLRGEAAHAYCLAEPGGCHVAYIMAAKEPMVLGTPGVSALETARRFDLRTGVWKALTLQEHPDGGWILPVPDDRDWVFVLGG